MELYSLFVSAFLSSTLLPGGSEIALGLIAAKSNHAPSLLITIATLGNTLGALTSWWLGGRLPNPDQRLDKKQRYAIQLIKRHSSPILLLSWLPIIGDPLCFIAGWLRIPFLPALIYIAIGKCLRYCLVVYLVG